jgi:diadenosine tetraphosphate (Ap4A) HIT family hydrolase
MAELHPQLAHDCVLVGRFALCRLLLMRDANYPWTILVPDRQGVTEIYQLSEVDQQQLLRESSALSRVLVGLFRADKLNIAALGNLVPQLHVHHVVRYRNDPAWPAPVWGRVPPKPYQEEELAGRVRRITQALATNVGFRAQVDG